MSAAATVRSVSLLSPPDLVWTCAGFGQKGVISRGIDTLHLPVCVGGSYVGGATVSMTADWLNSQWG